MAGRETIASGSFSRRLITSRPAAVMVRVELCSSTWRSTSTAGNSRSQPGEDPSSTASSSAYPSRASATASSSRRA